MKKLLIAAIITATAFMVSCGSNTTEDKLQTNSLPNQTEESKKEEVKKEKFKLNPEQFSIDNNIELKAIDVEFDMSNNVDKNFLIEGSASLDDYYNYNYSNERANMFCVKVRPNSNDAGNPWYVYFDREEFKDLYDVLKLGDQDILVNAVNPANKNKESMGNLATGEGVSFDKSVLEKTQATSKGLTEFMSSNQIKLKGIDVQFDMKNNIDKSFAIEGTAELSDYYNFNFRGKEKEYFNVQLDPSNDDVSDYWNLYFPREDFKDLFEKLKTGEKNIKVKAIIPSNLYKDGMGNMAVGELVVID